MKRKSSIHIEAGKLGYCFHNDRTKPTANSIFLDEKNEVDRPATEAVEIYREELRKRSEAYTKRTGRKLHKKTITHLSAVVNLDDGHDIEDVRKIADHLEQTLGTKIFQIAVHRDEGHVDEETGEKRINYHAHIEMLGLDENGQSVRRKLTKRYLIELQTQVAQILSMERGINYTKERKKRPKRLDTYEYKEHARRQAEAVKPMKEELAKVKDLKAENARIREEMKAAKAKREHYAELEAEVKALREQVKAKELTVEQMREQIQAKEQELLARIKKETLAEAEEELEKFRTEIEEKDAKINKQLAKMKELELGMIGAEAMQAQAEKELEEERKKRIAAERRVQELLTPVILIQVWVEYDEKEYIRRLRHMGWSVSRGRGDSQFVIRNETGEEIEDKGERLVGSPEGDMEAQARMMFEIAIAKGWNIRDLIFVGDVKFQIVASRLKEEYWKYQREKDLQRLQGGRKRFHEGSGMGEAEKTASRTNAERNEPIPTGELDPSMRLAEIEEMEKMTSQEMENAVENAAKSGETMKKPVKETPSKAAYRQGNPFIPRR